MCDFKWHNVIENDKIQLILRVNIIIVRNLEIFRAQEVAMVKLMQLQKKNNNFPI